MVSDVNLHPYIEVTIGVFKPKDVDRFADKDSPKDIFVCGILMVKMAVQA